jgi:serine/threonine-protein kinase
VFLDRYRIERVIHDGALARVVAARRIDTGELFAIKLALPGMPERMGLRELFLHDARTTARLRSEHAPRVHDFGEAPDGVPYMVLEYLDGTDLAAMVRSRGPLPIEEAATYLLQACDAIAEAHGMGIVHRSLKLFNLFLVQRPDGRPCVKVLDFAFSERIGPREVERARTIPAVGGPVYMAPEQISMAKVIDPRMDIWAMGAMLYKLTTAREAFPGSISDVIRNVLQAEPLAPRQLRPEMSQEVEAVILRCLRKRPDERFQSIPELAAALRVAIGCA